MGAVHLEVSISRHHEQARALKIAPQMEKEIQGAAIRPVQVLQDEHDRPHPTGAAQEIAHCREEPPARLDRITPGLRFRERQPLPHLGDDARQIARPALELLAQRLSGLGEHIAAQRFNEGEIG